MIKGNAPGYVTREESAPGDMMPRADVALLVIYTALIVTAITLTGFCLHYATEPLQIRVKYTVSRAVGEDMTSKSDLIGSSPSPTVSLAIANAWNQAHPVGSTITYIDDSGHKVETTVTAPAEPMHGARCAKIAARSGWCCIDRLI